MIRVKEPWVIVLAGGSGERLRSVTTTAMGESIPKQFCRLGGRTSMLGMTLARAPVNGELVATPERMGDTATA